MTHDHPEPEHDALVNDVVEAFGRVEVPPMPEVVHTVALLDTSPADPAPEESASNRSHNWSLFMRRFSPLVAAAALLLAVGAFFIFSPGFDSNAVFAQAVQQFRTAQTMTFTMTTAVAHQDKVIEMDVSIRNPSWMQVEFEQEDQSFSQVFDFQSQQMVMLMPNQKLAQRINMEGVPRGENPNDIVAEFGRLDPEQATYLRDEDKDGVLTHVYDIHAGPIQGTTWVAIDSKRPIRVEVDTIPGLEAQPGGGPRIVMREFKWDVALDNAKFTLDIPEGYRVNEVDMSNAQPEDFTQMLRLYAALTAAPFPEDFGVETLVGMHGLMHDPGLSPEENHARLIERLKPIYGEAALAPDKLQDTMANLLSAQMGRGSIYLATLAEEAEHWRWVGGGVSAGAGDKALCWWKPKDSETYRVVFNDFSIREVAKSDLPIYPQ
ncbi:MAG: hypothetical protein AAGJ38_03420 [Planctomycetota bacterium]